MADNYQLFSEIIRALTPEEKAWAKHMLGCWETSGLERYEKAQKEQDEDTEKVRQLLKEAGVDITAIDFDDWPGFEWEISKSDNELWLYAEQNGNVSHVGEFVRAFLTRFHPDDCWHLTWANTCSRPRIGEFGGGGLFVTAQSVRFFDAGDWTARQLRLFEHRAKTAQI